MAARLCGWFVASGLGSVLAASWLGSGCVTRFRLLVMVAVTSRRIRVIVSWDVWSDPGRTATAMLCLDSVSLFIRLTHMHKRVHGNDIFGSQDLIVGNEVCFGHLTIGVIFSKIAVQGTVGIKVFTFRQLIELSLVETSSLLWIDNRAGLGVGLACLVITDEAECTRPLNNFRGFRHVAADFTCWSVGLFGSRLLIVDNLAGTTMMMMIVAAG